MTIDRTPAAAMLGTTLFVFVRQPDGRLLFNQAAAGGAFVGWQRDRG